MKHPTCPSCGGLLLVCQHCGQICDGNWRVCPVCTTPLEFHSAPDPTSVGQDKALAAAPSYRRAKLNRRDAGFVSFVLCCSPEERSAFLHAAKEEDVSGSEYADILLNERIEEFEQGHPIPAATKGRQQRLQLCLHPQTMSHLKSLADKRKVSVSSLARAIFFFWNPPSPAVRPKIHLLDPEPTNGVHKEFHE